MRPRLDRRILLKRHTRLRASNGKTMDLWGCCDSVDGRIERPTGEALEAAKAVHSDTTALLTVESLHGLAVMWRAVWRNTVFSVLAVTPGHEVGTTILHCTET